MRPRWVGQGPRMSNANPRKHELEASLRSVSAAFPSLQNRLVWPAR